MLHRENLHHYQERAAAHVAAHPRSMLWMGLGLGKTSSTLTAVTELMNSFQVYGVLVVAPLRVAQMTWPREIGKWSHLKHLTYSLIHSSAAGKKALHYRKWATRKPAHIYLVNYEGLQWLVQELITEFLAKGQPLPFNMIVIDECTKIKSTRVQEGGEWGAALRKILPYIPWRVGLTATPAPNGLGDLFGQYLVLDDGERLGTSYTRFRDAYFTPGGYGGYSYTVTESGEKFIQERVADITLQMDTKDYLELPPVNFNNIEVTIPRNMQLKYEEMERQMFIEFDSGATIEMDNAAVLTNRCRQFSNGAMYHIPEDKTQFEELHEAKLDALCEIIEALNGEPLLVGYQFQHDVARIKKRLDKLHTDYVHFDRKIKGHQVKELEDRWNRREIPVMIGHGQSIGHGLNLQYGCNNLAWFGLPWSSEEYDQFNGRIDRQGQTRPVMIHRLLAVNTLDYAVLAAQERKAKTQQDLRAAVQAYRQQKFGE